MPDIERFAVFTVAASLLFLAVLTVTTRGRAKRPNPALPPLALKIRRAEILRYLPMAILMAPAIHVFFSLFVGWHDYMPFPVYIPSLISFFP